MKNKIDFLGKKFVEVTIKVVIEYDADELDIEEVANSVVACFYNEDTYGNETFEPETDNMKVHEYEEVVNFVDVTETYKAKYSKVKGYIIYDNLKIPIDNGNKGYHYKDYNLNVGDKIETSIDIYYYSSNYGYELVFGDINLSNYE